MEMTFRTLVWEQLGAVVRITANRPEVLNAQSRETLDIQGHRRAMEASFKNYMLTIPHRQALGTYGAEARARSVKQRIDARDQRFGDTARRPV